MLYLHRLIRHRPHLTLAVLPRIFSYHRKKKMQTYTLCRRLSSPPTSSSERVRLLFFFKLPPQKKCRRIRYVAVAVPLLPHLLARRTALHV